MADMGGNIGDIASNGSCPTGAEKLIKKNVEEERQSKDKKVRLFFFRYEGGATQLFCLLFATYSAS